MTRSWFHIVWLLLLLFLAGCVEELPSRDVSGVTLNLRCADPALTKVEVPGDANAFENLIDWVDFFFYPGENPAGDVRAVHHIRMTKEEAEVGSEPAFGTASFRIPVSATMVKRLFPEESTTMNVLAIANSPIIFPNSLEGTERDVLLATRIGVDSSIEDSDFSKAEDHLFRQKRFLMSGSAPITLINRNETLVAKGDIVLERYACKLTVAVNVKDEETVEVPEESGNMETWRPMLEGMQIYLVNGAKSVKLSGIDDTPAYFSYRNNPRFFFQKNGTVLTPILETSRFPDTAEGKTYYNTYPMYTFPMEWTTYSTEEGAAEEPYLKLVLPWQRVNDGRERQYYYKIVLPGDEGIYSFVRNHWYHYYVDAAFLGGSDTDDASVEVEPTCYVLPWKNADLFEEKRVDIGNARYLALDLHDETDTLRNESSLTIPFTTSHPVGLKYTVKNGVNVPDIRVTRPYYGTASVGTETLGATVRKAGNNDSHGYEKGQLYLDYDTSTWIDDPSTSWITIPEDGMKVEFTHPLKNDYNQDNFDYSPYTITFTIIHKDKMEETGTIYRKDLTIIQYPAMYIEATHNSDNTIQKDNSITYSGVKDPDWFNDPDHGEEYKSELYYKGWKSQHWGYVFVNGPRAQIGEVPVPEVGTLVRDGKYDPYMFDWNGTKFVKSNKTTAEKLAYQWRTVWYTGGSTDIFKINVTVLPDESELVIGDPRELSPHTWDGTYTFAEAQALDGSFRRLTYYYAAEESDRTINMVAPSYRICSKMGGIEFGGGEFQDIPKLEARYRCAAYQEDGFPAGRWRLPTEGEVRFIAMLSAKNTFERLFNIGGTYWSANGAVEVTENSINHSTKTLALLRCVYDSWYWGDEQHDPRDQFVWGDKPR